MALRVRRGRTDRLLNGRQRLARRVRLRHTGPPRVAVRRRRPHARHLRPQPARPGDRPPRDEGDQLPRSPHHYTWDAEDRPTRVTTPGGTQWHQHSSNRSMRISGQSNGRAMRSPSGAMSEHPADRLGAPGTILTDRALT
ncbi:hypothetical protein DTL70_29170 [Streptomyces diacarni]|uniref:Uncharacterized protein n=1 Tax=Streptomyces diacarni TaxID=2800381 RepID=A0A367EEX7_9ACTN|nr:hypothetical protein DTL70_29170 [Streptomyces diacarni]